MSSTDANYVRITWKGPNQLELYTEKGRMVLHPKTPTKVRRWNWEAAKKQKKDQQDRNIKELMEKGSLVEEKWVEPDKGPKNDPAKAKPEPQQTQKQDSEKDKGGRK